MNIKIAIVTILILSCCFVASAQEITNANGELGDRAEEGFLEISEGLAALAIERASLDTDGQTRLDKETLVVMTFLKPTKFLFGFLFCERRTGDTDEKFIARCGWTSDDLTKARKEVEKMKVVIMTLSAVARDVERGLLNSDQLDHAVDKIKIGLQKIEQAAYSQK